MQSHSSRNSIDPRTVAIGTNLAITLLPAKPRLLDRIRARASFHVRQIKQLAETAAFRAPALRGVVAEHFRVQRLERAAAFRAGPFSRMDRQFASVIQGKERSVSRLQPLIDQP